MGTYQLEKPIWTEADFEVMGWHDSKLWGMLPNTDDWEYSIDLDYIFEWVHPKADETYFKFWVAPVTMVFENAYRIDLDIKSLQGNIEVHKLHMENPVEFTNGENEKRLKNTYRFECREGEISLEASGFRMYVRQEPILQSAQSLGYDQRGGISFGRELLVS